MHTLLNHATPWLTQLAKRLPLYQTTAAAPLRYGFALLMVALAFASRQAIGPAESGLPLLTFFTAAMLATIIAGFGPGLLAGLLGAALGSYYYMPPYGALTFQFERSNVLMNLLFAFDMMLAFLALKAMRLHHEQYRANRELLQAIMNGASDLIYVKDLAGNYRFANDATLRFTQRDTDSLLDHNDAALYPALLAAQLADEDHQVNTAQHPLNFEHNLPDAQGNQHTFHSTRGPLFNARGQLIGTFGIDRDVTDARRATAAILERLALKEQLEHVATLVPGAIYSFRQQPDGHLSFPYVSPALADIYGYSPEEVQDDASPAIARIHPDDQATLRNTIASYGITPPTGKTPQTTRFRVMHPTKGTIWVENNSLPVTEANGDILWYGHLQDISARVVTEEQMRLAASVFDMSAEAIVVTGPDARILAVNAAFTRLTGYSREEAIGQTPALLKSGRHDADFYASMWKQIHLPHGWQGEIWNRRKNGEIHLEWLSINAIRNDSGSTANYVGMYRHITVARESQQRMEYLATHDELTGLPNRTLFNDRLRQAVNRAERAGTGLALLCVDIDNFKTINDTLGHDHGDQLLTQAATRMMDTLRQEDTVARMGGDEFIILLETADKHTVTASADRLVKKLAEGYKIGNTECFLSATVGVSLYPDDANQCDTLLQHADTALHRAKELGKNTFQFFSQEMAERSRMRVDIERGLRQAIHDRTDLYLEYQPQIELTSRQLIGAEALIRWRRGDAVVPPNAFIPIAEASHLIVELGEWVIEEVCQQLLIWDAQGLRLPCVSVNLAARHFHQPDMAERISGIVSRSGLEPARICLEITEGAMEDVALAMQLLQDLQARGFTVSVDDFGTGFSSLAHLKRFPIHELKIDRSFVDGIVNDRDDRAITSAVIAMAQSLELRVVAEGVENNEQLQALHGLGCHIGQGYFFSRPLPVLKFISWAQEWRTTQDAAH